MQISVIIPTYRPKDYLFECLDSLRRQTLPISEWEMIIVLNGCNEPWHTAISDYLTQHMISNAHTIQTDETGVSNARNIGLDAAKGEYIAFIDDDDWVSETYFEELLRIARPNTIAASSTKAFSDTQAYIPYYLEQEYMRQSKHGLQPFYKAKKYFGGPCMKLIHRDMIGNLRFDTRFSNGEDSLFMFAISKNIQYINFTSVETIYYRRIRTGSATKGETGWNVVRNRAKLIHAFSTIYWNHSQEYLFTFYCTRILGAIHSILLKIK